MIEATYVTKSCCKRVGRVKRTRRTRPGINIGYAHVSTDDQQLHLQLDALTTADYTQIFHDEGISGAQVQGPGLDAALAALTTGDVLVVWRLDRLGRSIQHLVSFVHTLGLRGVRFQSLMEARNTTTAGSKLVFHTAKRRGKHLRRPRRLTREQVAHAVRMVRDGNGLRNRTGSENLTLAIPSPYGVLCRHGNPGGPTTRHLGTHTTRSPSFYWGA
jgi:DNA invertase Pin-like site-specific DNA recombinase